MKRKQPLTAVDTRCNEPRCGGGLFRTGDGADRISEYLGRIVVECDRCKTRHSIKIKPLKLRGWL